MSFSFEEERMLPADCRTCIVYCGTLEDVQLCYRRSTPPLLTDEATGRGTVEIQSTQAAAADVAYETAEKRPVERHPGEADAHLSGTPDEPAVQSGFTGLSASLGRALTNEPGLELKRGRGGEPGPTDECPPSGESDRETRSGMDTEEEQASRRRRLHSEEATGGSAADTDREESGTSSSGQAESAQNIGFRIRPPDCEETPRLEESIRGPAGAQIAGTSCQLDEATPHFPLSDTRGLDSVINPAASRPSDPSGVSSGWQSQQRSHWGWRRPPGIDYVWEEEEFLIAAGGARDSVVRHPLEGLRSAYATVRQPRVSCRTPLWCFFAAAKCSVVICMKWSRDGAVLSRTNIYRILVSIMKL